LFLRQELRLQQEVRLQLQLRPQQELVLHLHLVLQLVLVLQVWVAPWNRNGSPPLCMLASPDLPTQLSAGRALKD
jgi:hypothetical protein